MNGHAFFQGEIFIIIEKFAYIKSQNPFREKSLILCWSIFR